MTPKSVYYLVGNAHLDPVWQWRWQEGSAEALATVRSALDRMDEFPDFRFVCSSALIYRWIEAFAPDMFEEVKRRVSEGRFIPVGGMHVQPDCNNPSGEGFARQMLYTQRYFRSKLGAVARIGYNVDSFGHNANLPQLLKKGGMDRYIFMRPAPHEMDMDSDVFSWRAPDGSCVTAYRILDPYCFDFETSERLEERLAYLDEKSRTELDELPLFYGVGNHGGGPTVRNLELLHEYAAAHPEKKLIYSDLSDFFDAVEKHPLPERTGDLQHHASGCYSTVSHLKKGIRQAENALNAAESYSVLASRLCGRPYARGAFEEAWNEVCFLHFHDSMGGCSIREVHDDAREQYGFALRTASVEQNTALQSIAWTIDTSDRERGLPVVVFNPHGFEAEQIISVNRQARRVTDAEGRDLLIQHTWASSTECYWRRDTSFRVKVPALGYTVCYLHEMYKDLAPDRPEASTVTASLPGSFRTANNHDPAVLENSRLRVCFDLHSGYIVSMTDKESGQELITAPSAVPTVIDEYYHDTWSHAKNYFTDVMARFGDATVSVTENGPLRATVKVESRYGRSELIAYYTLEEGSDRLNMRLTVDWQEKHKMLKMAWNMRVASPRALYEIPFASIERPSDGEEEPGLRYTAVVDGEGRGFALVNDGTYSSSVKDGTILQTLLRSPIYGDHGGPRTEESEFSDLGRHDFACCLMPVRGEKAEILRQASLLGQGLTYIIGTWHGGTRQARSTGGLAIDRDNLMLSACKMSEEGEGLVLRLYETEGRDTDFTVTGELLDVPLCAHIGANAVETYLLRSGADRWERVLLTEEPMA